MTFVINRKLTVLWLIVWAISAGGCASLIDRYDKIAYQNATSIKVDALVVMDKATEPYSQNESSVEALKIQVEKAYEYAKGRPKNEIVTKQWDIMKDPNRNLLGGFLARWKDKKTLSKIFITEVKNNISLGFDQIIGLESGKIKPESGE
ncbi:hypothetical protein [uncultured Desulfuromonas sp.]|uniref:hypothetical protein n=1 Tax=uncultured Desulfuromonas sp. TaxID=181013 RepID=UPI002AAA941F|nr:hypothetical protein [uncultured Desulfuromonas sp.]